MPRPQTIYLDWNASAPVLDEVRQAVRTALMEAGNPASVHRFGRAQRTRLEDARDSVAHLVGGADGGVKAHQQITFTSGGTEALAMALHGLCESVDSLPTHGSPPSGDGRKDLSSTPRPILISAVEHPAVFAAAHAAGGRCPGIIPVTRDGLVDMEGLNTLLDAPFARTPLVAVQLANHETGVIQPIRHIADRVHALGGLLLCDAVQAAGKLPLSLAALGADALALSAHKIGGLPGSGALVLAQGRALHPLMAGGGQERGLRGGTPNLPGIIAFGVAARHARQGLANGHVDRIESLRTDLQSAMLALAPHAMVHGRQSKRLSNTLSIGLPGVDQHRQVMALDLAGIAVSAGSACSSGKVEPSPVLLAMGVPPPMARQTIRISLGPGTTKADLSAFLEVWTHLAQESTGTQKNLRAPP